MSPNERSMPDYSSLPVDSYEFFTEKADEAIRLLVEKSVIEPQFKDQATRDVIYLATNLVVPLGILRLGINTTDCWLKTYSQFPDQSEADPEVDHDEYRRMREKVIDDEDDLRKMPYFVRLSVGGDENEEETVTRYLLELQAQLQNLGNNRLITVDKVTPIRERKADLAAMGVKTPIKCNGVLEIQYLDLSVQDLGSNSSDN